MRLVRRQALIVLLVAGIPATALVTPSPSVAGVRLAPQTSIEEGRYCYFVDGETLTAGARVDVTVAGDVAGWLDATVHDDANAYYTSYSQEATGFLAEGTSATMNVTTWIEYDVQDSEEDWTLTEQLLVTPQGELARTDCTELDAIFADESTVEGDYGYPWHYRRVRFEPGSSATVVRWSVVRGERDVWLLRAREGQVLTLWIDAYEDNAVFDLVDPDGTTLVQESREERLELPMHGEYQIWVGGTRGNASYELVIAVR